MNKYHIITLILCLFCLGGAATASPDRTAAAPDTQARSSQLKVSGIIKDDVGSPLIGVTIVVKGTSSGSSTAPASANVRAATCRDRSN